jgi:hypothetical protein
MTNKRFEIAWKLAVEFSVIVAGVLVALIVESWWSDREERQFERDLIEDMAVEFDANILILENDMAENRLLLARMTDLLAMSPETILTLSDRDFESTLFVPVSLAVVHIFDPAMGITQALVQSGELPRIKDRSLRLRMANWSALLEEGKRFSENSVRGIFELRAVIAESRSDSTWSEAERLELQYRMEFPQLLAELVLQNQSRLHAEAGEIKALLESRQE